ncbi:MAG: hypothetical protein DRO98_08675, partial [Archaeoglobales archaeon]
MIPTYNRKELLKECLESLFNQSYPKDKYEIVVDNDGSTDATEELLREYEKKAPCKLRWFTQQNKGPAAARNLGIKNARGEIICFIDDDDIAHRDWIKNMVTCFSDKRIGGVAGRLFPKEPKTLVEKYCGRNISLDYQRLVYAGTGNAAYRRDVLLELGGFDTSLRTHEDRDLGIRVQLKGYKLKYCKNAITYCRFRSTLKELIRQEYRGAIGLMVLGKKYPGYFSPYYYILAYTLKALRACVIGVIKILGHIMANGRSEIKYTLFEQIINVTLLLADLAGIIRGALIRYNG